VLYADRFHPRNESHDKNAVGSWCIQEDIYIEKVLARRDRRESKGEEGSHHL
jgi:hypothetical protein